VFIPLASRHLQFLNIPRRSERPRNIKGVLSLHPDVIGVNYSTRYYFGSRKNRRQDPPHHVLSRSKSPRKYRAPVLMRTIARDQKGLGQ
ncbi:mCG145593, partial [Mus musculus]